MSKNKLFYGLITTLLLVSITAWTACSVFREENITLKVIYAGSLIVPFEEIKKQFESKHPKIKVEMEGHGSIQAIRHVTDLKKQADVLAVADYSLIPDLMYEDYADWLIRFATNQIVIAYTGRSKYAGEINSNNWYEILSRPEVKFGFSNPYTDACGYRTFMVIQLAEIYYREPKLVDRLISANFTPSITTQKDNDHYTVFIPGAIKPKETKIHIRGGSIQVLSLLETGIIDYAFEYKSVALQHGLKFIELPPRINLGSPGSENFYNRVKVKFGFSRFTRVSSEQTGKTIFYALTIPKNSRHKASAEEYVRFVIGPEGKKILQTCKHPVIPPQTDNPEKCPAQLISSGERLEGK